MAISITFPTSIATQGIAYSSTFSASGGTGPYTWAILTGALPTGLSLNASTGAVTGTPTVSAVFTFKIQATDSLTATGSAIGQITVSGGSVPPQGYPVAAHTFDFRRVYLSTRTGGAPGTGGWTVAEIIFDSRVATPTFSELNTFSAGALTADLSEPRGIVGNSFVPANFQSLTFIGNGLPATPINIDYTGHNPAKVIFTADYWDMSQGAAWQNNKYHLLTWVQSESTAFALSSVDGSNPWTRVVLSGYTGTTGLYQRLDNKLLAFLQDVGGTTYAVNPFNMDTELWETPTAVLTDSGLTFGTIATGGTGLFSNGLIPFPNGDYGILCRRGTDVIYKEWTALSDTWGSDVVLPGARLANLIIDPGREDVHTLTYDISSKDSAVHYSKITHGGTLVPDIFIIPAAVGTSDGVGHPSIQNSMMFVPRDDSTENYNAVWVALLSDGQFVKEFLPSPADELNHIGSISIAVAGSGYAINDTGFISGNVGQNPAIYKITSVGGGGAVTGVSVYYSGGGYSVGVAATTTGGVQPGAGTGFTVNILTIVSQAPSCAYMMFPNGVSSITLACPVGGGTGSVGVPYSKALVVTGGTPPYTFTLTGGSLPPGLSLNTSTGVISGTPTTPGSYTYSVLVTDADGLFASITCTIVITGPSIACPVGGGSATLGVFYSAFVVASGGTPPYTFAIIGGALPTGLSLNTTTGEISGIPTQTGTFTYVVQVTDSLGAIVSITCQIIVVTSGGGCIALSLITPPQNVPGGGGAGGGGCIQHSLI